MNLEVRIINIKLKNWKADKKFILIFSLFLISHFLFLTCVFAADSGEVIKKIEVEGLSRIKQSELVDIICFHEGDTIDREELRTGIKRALKKGVFYDVQAVAEPYEDGIKLRYIVREIPVIEKISIDGNKEISKRKIKKAFIFKKGEDFKKELINKAKAGLKHFYYRKGFPDAEVRIIIEESSTAGRVKIRLQMEEGKPLIVNDINILSYVEHKIKISKGDIFDIDKVEKRLEELRKYFKRRKHIKPVVGPYEFKNGVLTIPVIPGPRLNVVFKGNKAVSSRKLLGEVPFLEDEEVTLDLLQESVNRIKRLYQKKGYYYIQVSGGIEAGEKLMKVVFFIFEGKKVILREIKFEGVSLSPDAVKAIMPLEEDEPFDNGLLSSSKESIINFYNSLGYIYADVTAVREEFLSNGSELNLEFSVKEGARVEIKNIEITGNTVISTSVIKDVLKIKKGDPYNEIDIGDARFRVFSLYNRLGYVNAEVEEKRVINDDAVFLSFKITEKQPFVFGKIVIRGNKKTKDNIVKREFDIKEGEPYNYAAIFSTRQKLYKLGLFSEISIEPLERSQSEDAEKTVNYTQDLLVDLKEGNPGVVEVGLGYGDYEGLRGFFDVNYRNISGYNRQISLRTELNSIEQRVMLNFTEPWFFNQPSLPFNVTLTKEKTRSIDIDTRNVKYKVDRVSLVAGVTKEFNHNLKGTLNYEYSLVETSDVEPDVILSKEDTGTLGISSISPSLFYDTRDNPFDPKSGSLQGILLKFASSALISETDFIKAAVKSSWYIQVMKRLVFAFSMQGGLALGLGDTSDLPLIERFFLGGRSTVRGYEHDDLGPKGEDDNATGGNVFALLNSELRISLKKGFGLVTFVDAGNVWEKIEDVEPALRYTVGLGLRYNTPVGPFRVDYGHKLSRREGESAGKLHFSIGHAF